MESTWTKAVVILWLAIPLSSLRAEIIGYWKLDRAGGNVAVDSSGYGHHGTIVGTPRWTDGVLDNALRFDGEYIDCGDTPHLDVGCPLTIMLWMSPAEQGEGKPSSGPMCKGQKGVGWSWQLRYNAPGGGNYLGFQFNGVADRVWVSVRQTLVPGQWYHVVGTVDGQKARCYLNGNETDASALSGFVSGRSRLFIGQDGWEGVFRGVLDEVCVLNTALSAEEVKQVYRRYTEGGEALVAPGSLEEVRHFQEARLKAEGLGPKEAILFLGQRIAEHERRAERGASGFVLDHASLYPNLYLLLGQAKQAAGAPVAEAAGAYRMSILSQGFSMRDCVRVMLWLFENTPRDEYVNIVRESVRRHNGVIENPFRTARDFAASGNWEAFELCLDAVIPEIGDWVSTGEGIAMGLADDRLWRSRFAEYAERKPQLAQYVVIAWEKRALEEVARGRYPQAAMWYRNLAARCSSRGEKTAYELKAIECVFNQGDYRGAISRLASLAAEEEAVDGMLPGEMILLQARAHVHLGEVDRADAILSRFVDERRGSEEMPQARFLLAYGRILQGKHSDAEGELRRLVDEYPETPSAIKARLCLASIERDAK